MNDQDPMSNAAMILQLVRQNEDKQEQGHRRLRVDWRDHEERIIELEAAVKQHDTRMTGIASASHDLSQITLSPGVVASIVLTTVAIVGGQIASTWGMRSDIRDISTHMNLQADVDRGLQKIQEERASALRSVVDEIKKKQDLQQLEIQSLRETILGQRRSR